MKSKIIIKFQRETINTIFTNMQLESTEILMWNQIIYLKKNSRNFS